MISYLVYITADSQRNVLDVGATDNIQQTMLEYRYETGKKLVKKNVDIRLVYFEEMVSMEAAQVRADEIEKMTDHQKIHLVYSINQNWQDMARGWFIESDLGL